MIANLRALQRPGGIAATLGGTVRDRTGTASLPRGAIDQTTRFATAEGVAALEVCRTGRRRRASLPGAGSELAPNRGASVSDAFCCDALGAVAESQESFAR
jgi:hypothetical protein